MPTSPSVCITTITSASIAVTASCRPSATVASSSSGATELSVFTAVEANSRNRGSYAAMS
ncbi:MAG TPA: hypothetical protein VFI88_02105 [Sphingomicrobium sp.]|jgi:hypothetical protein|nr:hypothetical protein [Sphingomicrobium sp.]